MPTLARFQSGSAHVSVGGDFTDLTAADFSGHNLDVAVDGDVIAGGVMDGFTMSDGTLTVEDDNVEIDNARLTGAIALALSGNNHRLHLHIDPASGTSAAIVGDALFGSELKFHVSRSTSHIADYFADFDGCDDNTIEIEIGSNVISAGSWAAKHLIRLTDSDRNKVAIKATYVNFTTNNAHDFITISGTSSKNTITGGKLNRISGSGNRPRHAVNITDAGCVGNRVVGNDFGAKAAYVGAVINDAGTDTFLYWPSDPDVGDNFVDEATTGGAGGPAATVSQLLPLSHHGILTVTPGTHLFPFPFDAVIIGVTATAGVAPDGDDIIIDVNKNGTTIFTGGTNRPTILDGTQESDHETPAVTTVAAGDLISVDIDQVGIADPGEDLTIAFEWRHA